MKIRRFDMEDWLTDNAAAELNLAESGCADYTLGRFLELCGASSRELERLWLGNNDTRGSLPLREAISDCYESVTPAELLVANGTSEALFAFFNELLEPGDEVVVPVPAFQCLTEIPASIGCTLRELDLMRCPKWRLDLDALEALVTEATRLIIVNTPHNPVGWALDRAELERLAAIAEARGAALLFDEHYRFLPLRPGAELFPSGYDVCKPLHEETYATGSMIKCLGMVGVRIGWLVGDGPMLDRCRDYKDYLSHTIPLITDELARLGLINRERILADEKAHILPNLAALEDFMVRHADRFEHVTPEGGVVCFPRLRGRGDAAALCRDLLREKGVSLLPGFGFGVPDHFRLNFGVAHDAFLEALSRIESLL
jgi:aspartate/methionine/tyrosine aminotransferase